VADPVGRPAGGRPAAGRDREPTLLDIIAGLEKPDKGQVMADNQPVLTPGRHRLVMFQESALFPWLNTFGNVMFGLKLKPGLRNSERREVAKFFLHLVGLEKFMEANVHELSGGMKQRVALARALDHRREYAEAFTHYQQGNELKHQQLVKAGQAFNPTENRRLIHDAIATFTPAFFERVKSFGHDSEMPIFVVGMPRSGTSLVEQIVASHPSVFGAGELKDIPRAVVGLAGGRGAVARAAVLEEQQPAVAGTVE